MFHFTKRAGFLCPDIRTSSLQSESTLLTTRFEKVFALMIILTIVNDLQVFRASRPSSCKGAKRAFSPLEIGTKNQRFLENLKLAANKF